MKVNIENYDKSRVLYSYRSKKYRIIVYRLNNGNILMTLLNNRHGVLYSSISTDLMEVSESFNDVLNHNLFTRSKCMKRNFRRYKLNFIK